MQHLKRLIIVFTLGLFFILLSNWPMALAAAPQASNLFVVPYPAGLLPACTQSDPCRLQDAMNKAVKGDRLYLAAGTYTSTLEAVLVVTKSVALYGGWNGAASGPIMHNPVQFQSILDGQGARRVVYIDGAITPTLNGLFITKGSGSMGGGIYAQNASPIIRSCRVYSNSALFAEGGGIYLVNGSAAQLIGNQIYSNTSSTGGGFSCHDSPGFMLTSNQIYSNVALFGGGGGGALDNCPMSSLSDNTIRNNDAENYGGGLDIEDSPTTTLTHNQVHHNTARQHSGGGIDLTTSPAASLIDNEVYSNTSMSGGGGLSLGNSASAVMLNNRIYGNTAFQPFSSGGGINLSVSPTATVAHNQIYQNWAHSGGGLFLDYQMGGTVVADNQVYSNTANSGGGIFLSGMSGVTLTGNLIRSNRVISYEGGGLFLAGVQNAILLNNAVLNNQLANSIGCGSGIKFYEASANLWHTTVVNNTGGTGAAICLDRSPSSAWLTNTIIANQAVGLWVSGGNTAALDGVLWSGNDLNFDGYGQIDITQALTGSPAFAADGYHLTASSAALNAGAGTFVMTDIDSDLRPIGLPDIGADEFALYLFLPAVLKQ